MKNNTLKIMAESSIAPLIFCLFILLVGACTTKVLITKMPTNQIDTSKMFIIQTNKESKIIATGIYPTHKTIDQFVTNTKPSFQRIDSLLYNEFRKRNIKAIIQVKPDPQVYGNQDNIYLIKYQDYWGWDFKMFMQLLKVDVYNLDGYPISEYVSQGNTAGIHNFPMPAAEVPKLVELIIRK